MRDLNRYKWPGLLWFTQDSVIIYLVLFISPIDCMKLAYWFGRSNVQLLVIFCCTFSLPSLNPAFTPQVLHTIACAVAQPPLTALSGLPCFLSCFYPWFVVSSQGSFRLPGSKFFSLHFLNPLPSPSLPSRSLPSLLSSHYTLSHFWFPVRAINIPQLMISHVFMNSVLSSCFRALSRCC